jgi:hypothetical protein
MQEVIIATIAIMIFLLLPNTPLISINRDHHLLIQQLEKSFRVCCKTLKVIQDKYVLLYEYFGVYCPPTPRCTPTPWIWKYNNPGMTPDYSGWVYISSIPRTNGDQGFVNAYTATILSGTRKNAPEEKHHATSRRLSG